MEKPASSMNGMTDALCSPFSFIDVILLIFHGGEDNLFGVRIEESVTI